MRTYHRNAAIFTGIFTLIQGGVWAYFAVWSVGIYSCTFDYPYLTSDKNTLGNLFYFSYEIGQCRYSSSDAPQLGPPHRTYAIMLTYGIASAIWIPSSILILVAAVNRIHGKTGARCYYPWLFITAVVLVLDIIGIIIYAIDITNTMTVTDYQKNFPYVPPTLTHGMDGFTVVPALIMLIFCCRAVIIYILNVVLFGVMIQVVLTLNKRAPTAEFVEREARVRTDDPRPSPWARIRQKSVGVPELELSPQRSPVKWEDSKRRIDNIIQSPTEERERPPVVPARSAIRPSTLPLSSPPEPPPTPATPFFDVYGKPTTPDSPQPVFARTISTPANQILEQGVDKDRPWSYVNPQQIPPPPKPIPEPDYTMHRGPSSRPNILSSSNTPSTPSEEEEIRPTKRYENNPNVWKVM